MAVDIDAVDDLFGSFVSTSLWTNYVNRMTGITKRRRFRPDTTVEWNRKIFDND
jgi:hypothetical protein